MIDVVYKRQLAPGMGSQALEWAKKLIGYMKKAGFIEEAHIIRPLTGEHYGFSFVLPFASMAEYEERRNKWRADSGWTKILREGASSDWYLGNRNTIFERVEY